MMTDSNFSPRQLSNSCYSPYNWYTCNYSSQPYAGCCDIDPCRDVVGCPSTNQQPNGPRPTEAVPTPPLPILPSTAAPIFSVGTLATVAPASSTTSPAPADASHQDGLRGLPSGALIVILVGSCLFILLFSIWLYMQCWRRQRMKRRTREQATVSSPRRTADEDFQNFHPQFISHSAVPESHVAGRPVHAYSAEKSPLSPLTMSRPAPCPELDSKLVNEIDSSPRDTSTPDPASLGRNGLTHEAEVITQESTHVLRATLNSTQKERDSNTFATSWTKFHHVQL